MNKSFKEQVLCIRAQAVLRLHSGRGAGAVPGGGAGGDSLAGGDLPGSIGSSALLQAEVLDLDKDEDDLKVFSKDASLMDTKSFSLLMPTSPLSRINQVKFEDEPDLKDLFITVKEPESYVTTIETFIPYRIITKTSREEFDSSDFEVGRCYQDFLWLKEKLGRSTPDSDYSTIARKVYSERNGGAL